MRYKKAMLNNDILRRVRYILNFDDSKMIEVFGLCHMKVSQDQLLHWLKKEDDPDYVHCADLELASFLTGLIVLKRGKREGDEPKAEKELTNNIVFRKLMIAFSLNSDDVLKLMESVDFRLSKHELSAFFRKTNHKNYRECKAQILRNFLNAIQSKGKTVTE